MREEKYYCDICGKEKSRYSLFDIALQLTERTNSNLQGQRTIVNKEICNECLDSVNIKPTNKQTYSSFGLNEYDEAGKSILKLIKDWFGNIHDKE